MLIQQLQESHREKDAAMAAMQAELESLRASVEHLRAQDLKSPKARKVVAMSYEVEADGVLSRSRVGRHASLATTRALSSFPLESTDDLATRMVEMFRKPLDKIEYLNSPRFATDLITLCGRAKPDRRAS